MKKTILFISFLILFFVEGFSQSWYPLNGGFESGSQSDRVNALCNDTIHNILWAGGRFTETTTGDTVNNIAYWDGYAWNPFYRHAGITFAIGYGTSSSTEITSLLQFDSMVAIGTKALMVSSGGVSMLNMEDSLITAIGTFNDEVNALCIYHDTLYAAGAFSAYKQPGIGNPWIPMNGIAKWNGADFVPVGGGLGGGYIDAMCVHNDKLVVGGFFENIDGIYCKNIGQWDGTLWTAIGTGIGTMGNFSDYIKSLASYHGKLYAGGGDITISSGTNLLWSQGGTWTGVNSYFAEVNALHVFNELLYIGGPCLVLGPPDNEINYYNDTSFFGMGYGPSNDVRTITNYNGNVYAGGIFPFIDPFPFIYTGFVARYDPTLLPVTNNISIGICTGEVYDFNGILLDSSGEYLDTLTATNGADSIVVLTLTINQQSFSSITQSICDGDNYNFNGNIITSAGTYYDTLSNASNCDSLITLVLNVTSINAAISISNDTLTASGNGNMQWFDCNTNQQISGATNNTYIPSTSGNYATIITNGNCSDTTECVNYTGINQLQIEDYRLQIYPNPANETVNITAENIQKVIVSNLLGMQMLKLQRSAGANTRNDMTIDISKLPQGIYLLRVQTNDGWRVGKMVKE